MSLVVETVAIGTFDAGGQGVGLGVGQLGFGLGQRHLVVVRIDFDQDGAGFDVLVVDDAHLEHGAADPRRRSG